MNSGKISDKSIHAAVLQHDNDKLKELLLELKFVFKDHDSDPSFVEETGNTYELKPEDAETILNNPDVKVRQFGSYCIAVRFRDFASKALIDAYLSETVDYNKEHLIKAVSLLEKPGGIDRLHGRLSDLLVLLKGARSESHIHYIKEARSLLSLIRRFEPHRSFTGDKLDNEIILTTNRNFRELTLKEIKGFSKKTFNAGVMVRCDDISKISQIRTYEELLFVPPFDEEHFGSVGKDEEITRAYVKDHLAPFILERMKAGDRGSALPVSFRLDIKGIPVSEKEEILQKELSQAVEEASGYELINIRNDFDIQIRFVARKTGILKPLIRFFDPRDERFSYKTTDIAAGIKPYLAALICRLCGEYMFEDANVLDPFCGAGTLLVERDRFLKTGYLFGSDLYPAACSAAEKNLKSAGLSGRSKIINRDFLSLEHKEPFDEMITDLPFETEKKTEKELDALFGALFVKTRSLLKPGAFMFVYTRNPGLLKKHINKNKVQVIKCFEISKREDAFLFILKN